MKRIDKFASIEVSKAQKHKVFPEHNVTYQHTIKVRSTFAFVEQYAKLQCVGGGSLSLIIVQAYR